MKTLIFICLLSFIFNTIAQAKEVNGQEAPPPPPPWDQVISV
jgi:hypothetical protein